MVDALWAAFPEQIGQLRLGERPSDGDSYCAHSHDVPAGHPLYWPPSMGRYDDSDPYCLTHAIEKSEAEQGWCECEIRKALDEERGS